MQHQPLGDLRLASESSSAEQDDQMQAVVLSHVLLLHPIQLTQGELSRELTGASNEFAAIEEIDRGVRDLVAVGLLHRHGLFVIPSRAASRFHELMMI
jgi:hypothetical protein